MLVVSCCQSTSCISSFHLRNMPSFDTILMWYVSIQHVDLRGVVIEMLIKQNINYLLFLFYKAVDQLSAKPSNNHHLMDCITFEGLQLTTIINHRRHSEICRPNKWYSSISRSKTSAISWDVKARFTCDVIDLSILKYVNTNDDINDNSLFHDYMGT